MKVGVNNQVNRETWLENTLAKISPGSRILDAGAGELKYKKFCAHLNYVAQDFGRYDGSGDQRGLHTRSWDQSRLDIVCDIVAIPEPDASFDAIMCVEVFEHLPDPLAAIREFSRLLKPGGLLVLTAPFCSLTHFAPYHFYSGFNRYFYEIHLGEQGFDVLDLNANGNFFEYLAQELRRVPSMAKKYAKTSTNRVERLLLRLVLKSLGRLSARDERSDELLCFGYHVLARKQ